LKKKRKTSAKKKEEIKKKKKAETRGCKRKNTAKSWPSFRAYTHRQSKKRINQERKNRVGSSCRIIREREETLKLYIYRRLKKSRRFLVDSNASYILERFISGIFTRVQTVKKLTMKDFIKRKNFYLKRYYIRGF